MKKILLLTVLLASCAGYHFTNNTNPFYRMRISSISVPMFINETPFSSVSAPMTKEMIKVLKKYPDLTVYSGENVAADAILIGVIKSEDKVAKAMHSGNKKYISDSASIGSRGGFYVPESSEYKLRIELTMVQDPTKFNASELVQELKNVGYRHPKVVFNDSIELNGSFTRVVNSNHSVDDGAVVNNSQNRALFTKSIEDLSVQAAAMFKDVIIDAF